MQPGYIPFFCNFEESIDRMKNTSLSLGNHFDQFVTSQISAGRYKNVSEVVRARLRLLEDEESKTAALRAAIQKGIESPLVETFNFTENLKKLKEERKNSLVFPSTRSH